MLCRVADLVGLVFGVLLRSSKLLVGSLELTANIRKVFLASRHFALQLGVAKLECSMRISDILQLRTGLGDLGLCVRLLLLGRGKLLLGRFQLRLCVVHDLGLVGSRLYVGSLGVRKLGCSCL